MSLENCLIPQKLTVIKDHEDKVKIKTDKQNKNFSLKAPNLE